MTRAAGAVLAGGESRRMGRDKALIEIGGRPLLQVATDALAAAGLDPIVVVGGDASAIGALGHDHVADRHPGEGPLGGIISALAAVPNDTLVVLSCDLTDASPIAVSSVIGALGDADVAVPVVDGREQWMHSAWRRRSLSLLEAAFAAGHRSVAAGAEGLRVSRILDGDPCWYHDADTPDDLPPTALR